MPFRKSSLPDIIFGDGSDGAATNPVLPSGDAYYTDLLITAGNSIRTGGGKIFCQGTLYIENTGSLHSDGFDATGNGILLGLGGYSGTLGTGGGAGGSGSTATHAPNALSAPGSRSRSINSASGGNSYDSAGGSLFTHGIATAPSATDGGSADFGLPFKLEAVLTGTSNDWTSNLGGGGGGGGGGTNGSNGGAGGGGGGVLFVCARTIDLSDGGTISTKGGEGYKPNPGDENGLAGGGGGGIIILTCREFIGDPANIIVLGGNQSRSLHTRGTAGRYFLYSDM